ncbi:rapamycin-insensitive companion of mTOR [Onthophagus taurus]|uniref:rapamycin-insensitive companion of mTOR n=1 Tax=Onthophagus taurus TaxID=166361 RepID=UPI0039BE26BB
MAVASWMLGKRSLRPKYSRSQQTNLEDYVKLDLEIDPYENATEILKELTKNTTLSETKRLNYLNAFVKLTLHVKRDISILGFTVEDILICLRICVVNEMTQVRSGGFRAIRHVLNSEEDVVQFNKLLFPYLIARSFDLLLKNDVERIEAMKLVRKVMFLSPNNFHVAVSRSLVAFAKGGIEEKDRMLRACLATLSELCVLNPDVFIASGGVAAITRNLLECQTPRIAESLCGVLLLLLDRPITRNYAAVDLHCICAPYCDFHYRHGWMDKNRDERELRFNCSRLALLSLLRSWSGILHLCDPFDSKGFKAIVDVLYLNQLEVRKAVLDLLYELLGLPQPEWSDELSVALTAVDPAEPQAAWRLNEGFIVAEGRAVLPHLARTTPSITDMHLSLLLYCFLEAGLLGALVEVIITSDTFISVRATVLLGELIRLIQVMLPPECCNLSPALPDLLKYAVTNKPQALRAITALQQSHKMLRRRPASYSLYLDFILQSGNFIKTSNKIECGKKYKVGQLKTKLSQFVLKEDDFIRDSCVLVNKDPHSWDWGLVKVLLKDEKIFKIDVTETTHRNFLKRLIDFYKPTNHLYSHTDLTIEKRYYTLVGIELIQCLLRLDDDYCTRLLHELFGDISNNITAITSNKSPHDCLFSPLHMGNTQCQSYFLFIGRLGSAAKGVRILQNLTIFEQLQQLASTTNHSCYVKLIISSLDYKSDSPSKQLLSSVLICRNENSRLYATQFLLILLRAGVPDFASWGIEFLAKQLKDESRSIRLAALNVLHEACEVPQCLDSLANINPDLLGAMGEKGLFLLIRFLSTTAGFHLLEMNGFVYKEITRWNETFNYRYVRLVETETSDALTLNQRGEDGRYDKRTSSNKQTMKKDVFLPPHLYGQLSSHKEGFRILLENIPFDHMTQALEVGKCDTEDDILTLKAYLWALSHLGSSKLGAEALNAKNAITYIVHLAEKCEVYSIKATAFYCLGLIATTKFGADCLFKLRWVSSRHDRHDRWPVIEDENWEDENIKLPSYDIAYRSDSERSSDRLFPFAEETTTDTSITTDDEILFMGDAELTSDQKRSQTLPNNQSYTHFHVRSLSESRTYDAITGVDHKYSFSKRVGGGDVKRRELSGTESTSGVGSSESVVGKNIRNDRTQTLSPIPSSSSLLTLKTERNRRYSESSKQQSILSITPSDKSTVSPPSSSCGKPSYQDLKGYRELARLKYQDEHSDFLRHFQYRFSTLRSDKTSGGGGSSYSTSTTYDEYMEIFGGDKRSTELYRRPVRHDEKHSSRRKRCYMGICLPLELGNLFPESRSLGRGLVRSGSENGADTMIRRKVDITIHNKKLCFKCSQLRNLNLSRSSSIFKAQNQSMSKSEDEIIVDQEEALKTEILLQIERLANPLFTKSAKQTLLLQKQKNPDIFKDMCLYSDVCRTVSENVYRLGPRRIIQELFLDVAFDFTNTDVDAILAKERNYYDDVVVGGCCSLVVSATNKNVIKGFDVVTKPTALKEATITECSTKTENVPVTIRTLDKLKFTYNENKFPIKNRNDDEKQVIK